MTSKFGAIRRLPCGCINQYGYWDAANGPGWARKLWCARHSPTGTIWTDDQGV